MGTISKIGRYIIIMVLLALSFSLVTAGPVSAAGTPTIDAVIDAGEWDGAADYSGSNYSVYVLNDTEYLYVAFEANCGNYTTASSMTNIYIYAGDDYAGECWAYSVAGWVGDVGLDYFTIHHIQPPKVKEGKEARLTSAIVSIAPTVMEWQIPLAEFPMGPGEPLAFDFMSYSEGCSDWVTAWLYEPEYWAGVLNQDTGLYYTTIQGAIDAASGTTLVCAPGIYNESVTIDKSLILLGAQAGNCAIDRTGDESVIDCGWVSGDPVPSAIEFTANDIDVTIDGFKIIGSRGAVTTKGLDKTSVTLSALHFLNNIVEANTYTGGMNDAALVFVEAADIEVGCNDVSPTNVLSSQTNALRLTVTGVDSAVVDSNRLHNASSSGLGVQSNNPDAVITVNYNELCDNADDGMFTYNSGFKTLTISHNEIRNNTKIGVNIATGVRGTIRINCNNITGNNNFGVSVNVDYGGTVDAEYNWWGAVDGPGPVGSGAGDKVTTKVDYYPYLSSLWQVSSICNPQPAPLPPTPPSDHGAAVGIEVYSVDKGALVAPWIALAAVIIAGGIILVRRRKAHS